MDARHVASGSHSSQSQYCAVSMYGNLWTSTCSLTGTPRSACRGRWHLETMGAAAPEPEMCTSIPSVRLSNTDFFIDASSRVVYAAGTNQSERQTWLVYLHQLAPLLLDLDGFTVLHGSAVAIAGAGLCFMGDSEAGKSTLARAVLNRVPDAALVSDDVLALHKTPTGWTLVPGPAEQRLWPDSARQLLRAEELEAAEPAWADGDKLRVRGSSRARHDSASIPLSCLFFIAPAETLGCTRLQARQTIPRLLPQAFRFAGRSVQQHTDELSALADLATAHPAFLLESPHRYEALPDTVAEILECVDGHD